MESKVTIRLTTVLKKYLEEEAKAQGTTMSELIRSILMEAVNA